MTNKPFWQAITMEKMSDSQWESLCDGCGKCCLNKVIDDETEELFFTNVACSQLNETTCQCNNYSQRFQLVSDCFKVTLANRDSFAWLPASCAYRLIDEGKDLPSWHPLLTGSRDDMHRHGQSIRGKVISEKAAGDLEDHIVTWPLNFKE